MRVTLDIDDDVLKAAEEIAAAQQQTIGKVISELARATLKMQQLDPVPEKRSVVVKDGWAVLPSRGGIVTNDLVQKLFEDADWEDAGLKRD